MSSISPTHEHIHTTTQRTSSSSPSLPPSPHLQSHSPSLSLSPSPSFDNTPSDLPLLRRTHLKTGYRAGISAGKSDPETAQKGFDVGYPIGAGVGMRVGRVLGGLGYLNSAIVREEGGYGVDEAEGGVKAGEMMQAAERELSLEALMGEMGLADAGDEDSNEAEDLETADRRKMEAQLNVERIGESPTLLRWEGVLSDLGKRYGIDFGV